MPNDISAADVTDNANSALEYVNQASNVAGQLGATASQKTLQQAAAVLAAGVSGGVTAATVGAVAGSSAFASAIGTGALAGASAGPFGVAVGVFLGCMIAIGQMFKAGAGEDLAALAHRQQVARAAALEVRKQLVWLEQPAHLSQLKAAILSGYYTTAVNIVSTQLNDGDWGPGSSAAAWYAQHSDPLATFPASASVKDAMRLTFGKAGLFVGTPDQITATKAKLRAERLSHPRLRLGAAGSYFVATNLTQTIAQITAPHYVATDAIMRSMMTIDQLRGVTAKATAAKRAPAAAEKKPGLTLGEALLGAGAAALGYFWWL